MLQVTPKVRRRLSAKQRREAKIATVAAILKQGRPTVFAFEAACRHGLRAEMCLSGHDWKEADVTAIEIVASALHRIGAQRPDWNEAQPWWTDSAATSFLHVSCQRCGRRLPEQEAGWGHGQPRKYCSRVCAVSAHFDKNIEARRAYDLARYHAMKAAAPELTCQQCGHTFRSAIHKNRPVPRFCSNECYQRSRRSVSAGPSLTVTVKALEPPETANEPRTDGPFHVLSM